MTTHAMRNFFPPVVIRYATAWLAVTLALFTTWLIWPLVRPSATPLFLGGIVITAWLAGRGPALVATLLSGTLIDYFFIVPLYQLGGGWEDLSRLIVFTLEGTTLSWIIVSRRQIGDQVRESREQLRALSTHLQSVIEQERTRISREIHDELGQELTSLKFDVAWLRDRATKANKDPDDEKLSAILKNIDAAINSVRRIATELRPAVLDTLGLTAAIEWQASDFQDRTGIRCTLNRMEEDLPISMDAATTVFRVFQESLTNVARHANATEVEIRLERVNSYLLLRIEDNGKGVDDASVSGGRSLGILGMQERVRLLNGNLKIEGTAGRGTVVHVEIPLTSAGAPA
jgi:signal transduction histidine kinase